MHRRSALILVPVIAAALVAGCSPAAPPSPRAPAVDGPSLPPASPSSPPSESAAPSAAPPAVVWAFDAGAASGTGTDDLAFVGGHALGTAGVALDGATARGTTDGPGPIDTTASFTVAAWVSPNRPAPFAAALSQLGDMAAAFYLGFGEGTWAFSMKDMDTNEPGHTVRAEAVAYDVRPGSWTHLAGVHDAAAGEIRLYLDGRLATVTPFTAPWAATGPLVVGGAQAHGGPADFWPGAIGPVAAWQAALPALDIARLAATPPGAEPPVLGGIAEEPGGLRGTWDDVLSEEEVDVLVSLFSRDEAESNGIPGAETRIRFGFDGNRYWQGFVFDGELWLLHGVPEGAGGVVTVEGDEMTQSNGSDGSARFRWAIEGDELTMQLLSCAPQSGTGECADVDVIRFITDRTYVRSSTDPSYAP
ncbi:MAG TPA: LamG domain-containing protein [Candidatus Limnocylindrales bacterium]|nr:LamG domain-containing protein [Candidatus Limnocylindrales bacterium]